MSKYIITDGKRYIHHNQSGKYIPTTNIALAEVFTKKQAEGVYNNSLSKPLRAVFYIQDKDIKIEIAAPTISKKVTSLDLENTEKIMNSDNVQKWINRISGLRGITYDARQRKDVLEKELRAIEDELLDIEHWIEFSKFNGVQGFKACKELKECRVKRRSIKNELLVLDILLEQEISEDTIEQIDKRFKGIDKRSYRPRVRVDLFDLIN